LDLLVELERVLSVLLKVSEPPALLKYRRTCVHGSVRDAVA
jgi:hypothetical protein